jgi:hypothetical protein
MNKAGRAPLAVVLRNAVMSDRIGFSRCRSRWCDPLPTAQRTRSINISIGVAMNAFIYRLTFIHRRLDEEIRLELKRRAPSWVRLLRLKKLRLAVKDRLHDQMPARRRRLKPGRI